MAGWLHGFVNVNVNVTVNNLLAIVWVRADFFLPSVASALQSFISTYSARVSGYAGCVVSLC